MAMISTRGRYALRILIDLAENQGEDGYLPLKEICERQEISEKYLESIAKILVRGEILKGSRGKGGGYRLIRNPEECSLGSILRLTEGDLSPVSCLEEGVVCCDQAENCPTMPVWIRLNSLIQRFLDKKDARTQMIIGLGHDRIVYLGLKYIDRGYVTQDEYENLTKWLYEPYEKMGGNGSAKRIMDEVRKLPIRRGVGEAS